MRILKTVFKVFGFMLGAVVLVAAGYLLLMSGIFHTPESFHAPAAYQQQRGAVLVVGATRGTGLEVVKQLQARGETVVASVRASSNTAALDELGVEQVILDALQPDTVRAAILPGRFSAVISTLGTSIRDLPERRNFLQSLLKGQVKMDPNARPDFVGNKAVIDAAAAAGVKRFMLVTVIGAGDSAEAVPLPARPGHNDVTPLKTQAEDYLRASGMNYTIVRPGGLGPRMMPAKTGTAKLTEDPMAFSYMGRPDLAEIIVAALGDITAYNKTFTAYDENRVYLWDMFVD
jgi:nucleoside-diphosphate-sugar epimerase